MSSLQLKVSPHLSFSHHSRPIRNGYIAALITYSALETHSWTAGLGIEEKPFKIRRGPTPTDVDKERSFFGPFFSTQTDSDGISRTLFKANRVLQLVCMQKLKERNVPLFSGLTIEWPNARTHARTQNSLACANIWQSREDA